MVQLAGSHFSTTTLCQNLDEINIHGDYYNSFENSFTKQEVRVMWEILCGKYLRIIFRYKQALEDKANCTAELQKQLTVGQNTGVHISIPIQQVFIVASLRECVHQLWKSKKRRVTETNLIILLPGLVRKDRALPSRL